MDTQDPPIRPRYQLTRAIIGLDNEKDAMTSRCLDRKYDPPQSRARPHASFLVYV